MHLNSNVPADSSDAASIGRPCQGIDIPRLGIGISGLTKRNGARVSCFYAPDVYGIAAQRCSDPAPIRGPCQGIHALVFHGKTITHYMRRIRKKDGGCVPHLDEAIERTCGSDVLSVGGPGDGCHRSVVAAVRVKRTAEYRGLYRRWERKGRHRGGSTERVSEQQVYQVRIFKDEGGDGDTGA